MNITKFNISDNVIAINVNYKLPFVREFVITGIAVRDSDGQRETFYTNDNSNWVPESSLFASKKEAYNHIINQCESELVKMAHVKRFMHPKMAEIMAAKEKEQQEAEKMVAEA